ncbi:MAG: hypothetical protein COB59_11680, partial [Rhodospirillaceae bacterium]
EHTLIIKFRLPIVGDDDLGDGEIIIGGFDKSATLPPFKATPQSSNRFQRGSAQIDHSLIFAMELKSSSFWASTYSDHQEFLVRIILRLRSENMTFSQISGWLNKRNYETPRDKEFTANHVFSIYKKKQRRGTRIMASPPRPVLISFEIDEVHIANN